MNKIYTTIAFASIVFFAGCGKDFLTEEPPLAQSDALTLSSYEGLDKATAGAYAPLASIGWYGGEFILSNEMRTMNGKHWGFAFDEYYSGRYVDDYRINFTPNNTSSVWKVAYFVINAANSVIAVLDKVPGDAQAKNNLKAECLFLRALSHFDAVRTFAQPYNFTADASHPGVPIVLTVDPKEKPARSSVKDVYARIIEDLSEAEKIIDPAYARQGVKDSHAAISQMVIKALLSRVYLYSENWQKAADYATEVIDSKKYSMWEADKIATVYQEDVPGKGEVIFEVYMNTTQGYGTGNTNIWGMSWYEGYGDCGASADLQKLYESDDVRAALVVPDNSGKALFTKKYSGKGLGALDANNVILLRLSEMYLNRAEATLHGAKTPVSASVDLETITSNRKASSAPASLDGVYIERAKEFAWEGHLWFDLARTGRPMKREDVTDPNIPQEIPPKDHRWAMPIPNREFTVNGNLIQNEGYGK